MPPRPAYPSRPRARRWSLAVTATALALTGTWPAVAAPPDPTPRPPVGLGSTGISWVDDWWRDTWWMTPTPEPTTSPTPSANPSPTSSASPTPSESSTPAPRVDLAERIASDMTGTHEERPHGVPESYDWAAGPRVGKGNSCPSDWNAMIPWGHAYEPASGNPATNTRVHVKGLQTLYLSKSDGQWHVWQSSEDVGGAMYVEDFVGDESKGGPEYVRDEPDGGQSAIPGDGFNFHFWTPERATVDCSDIAGVVSTVQARLVVDDTAKPDDRSTARFLMSVGADYWRSLDAQWAADWSNNGDIGIGKFRFIGTEFTSYYMTTMTKDQLAENPPPL
ncbi:MAG: hypothetical protein ACRCSN_03360 [Dermatophilaceae bacterium]